MHNTTAYTSHIQNRNTWVIVDYHNELWENSKSSYTFVWATEKNVQERLSKSVHLSLNKSHAGGHALHWHYTFSEDFEGLALCASPLKLNEINFDQHQNALSFLIHNNQIHGYENEPNLHLVHKSKPSTEFSCCCCRLLPKSVFHIRCTTDHLLVWNITM